MRVKYLALMTLCFSMLLTGCTVANKIVSPYTKLKFIPSSALNPDISGRPSPVVIRVYELSESTQFESSDFFQLYEQPEHYLTSALLTTHDIEIQPGKTEIHELQLQDNTRYLGIIAAFRNIEKAEWRIIVEAKPHAYKQLKLSLSPLTLRQYNQ